MLIEIKNKLLLGIILFFLVFYIDVILKFEIEFYIVIQFNVIEEMIGVVILERIIIDVLFLGLIVINLFVIFLLIKSMILNIYIIGNIFLFIELNYI